MQVYGDKNANINNCNLKLQYSLRKTPILVKFEKIKYQQ